MLNGLYSYGCCKELYEITQDKKNIEEISSDNFPLLLNIVRIPLEFPVLQSKSDKCGIFEVNKTLEYDVDIFTNSYFTDVAFLKQFSVFDWRFIYTKTVFVIMTEQV